MSDIGQEDFRVVLQNGKYAEAEHPGWYARAKIALSRATKQEGVSHDDLQ